MAIERTTLDITVYKQRDFKMHVYIRDANNDPKNVTGWTGKAQIRENNSPESKLLVDLAVSVADAAAGKILVYAPKAETKVCEDSGYWDLALVNDEGYGDSYLVGDVTFKVVPTEL